MFVPLGCRLAALLSMLLVLGGTAACRSMHAPGSPVAVTAADVRSVYETLLREAYIMPAYHVTPRTQRFVLAPAAYVRTDEGWYASDGPRAWPQDAWDVWYAESRHGGRLPQDLDPGLPLHWFPNRSLQALPTDGTIEQRWPAFHERFPHSSGHIELSRIGFSHDGRTAIVYGFVGSGSLSASGDLFLLRRTTTGWRLAATHNCAIA